MAKAAARPAATDAFDAYVQVRSPQLLRTAHLLTGDRVSAERALTSALAATWRVWGELDSTTAAEEHTLRELVEASRGAAGRKRPKAEPVATDHSGAGTPRGQLPEGLGTGDASRAAARSSLRRQLAAMPPELRAVVVLRHAQGLSDERVAAILGEEVAQVGRAEQAAVVLLARDPDVSPYVGAGA